MHFRGNKLEIFSIQSFKHIGALRAAKTINVFCVYSFFSSVYKFRIFRSCLWGGISFLLTRKILEVNNVMSSIIGMIQLNSDGSTVDISFVDGSTVTVNITSIRRLSEQNSKAALL